MVLELLFNPFSLKKKPWQMFIVGFFNSIIALILSYIVFKDAAGLLSVFLVVMSTLPLFYVTIKREEELDFKYPESRILKEHAKVLFFFMFLFFGIMSAMVLAYVFLPQTMVNSVFNLQQSAIMNVNNAIQAGPSSAVVTGNITSISLFMRILFNNFKVLFFCLIFSFLYGAGAIFILTWNASVIASAMGNLIKTEVAHAINSIGLPSVATYFSAAAFSVFRYMTHGIFEIAAYFIAGLAGGIISIAFIKQRLKDPKIYMDVLDLVLISIGLLVVGGIIEVYITPVFFG